MNRHWRAGSLLLVAALLGGVSQAAYAVEVTPPEIETQQPQPEDPGAGPDANENAEGVEGVGPGTNNVNPNGDLETDGDPVDEADPQLLNNDPGESPDAGGDTANPTDITDEGNATDVAPTELPVTGTLVEVPAEPTIESLQKQEQRQKNKKPRKKKALKQTPIEDERFELAPEFQPKFELESDDEFADEPLEMAPGWISLVTDDGAKLRLDETTLDDALAPGDRIAATVELPTEAQDAVQEAIDEVDGDAVEPDELVRVAATAVAESGQSVTLKGESLIPTPMAASGVVPVKPHSADVVFFTTNKVSQESKIRSLMTTVSNYWKKESEGKVNGISVNAVKQLAPPAGVNLCDAGAAWDAAAKLYPGSNYELANPNAAGGPNPKHLSVFVAQKCPEVAIGYAYIYSPHTGGENYTNLGANLDFDTAASTAVHEFGHNLGFDHSNERECKTGYSDAAPTNVTYSGNAGTIRPGKLCTDVEYSDRWSPLGSFTEIPSLPFVMKTQVGFLDTPAVVSQSGGNSQTFTLKALSSTSGLRGIRVKHTGGTEEFTLEYRNDAGQDARIGGRYNWQKGVRAVKMVDTADGRMSTAVYNQGYGLQVGKSLHPFGGRARVTVVSMTSAEAKVRVDFTTSFTDVLLSDRFPGSIQWMYDKKISTGTSRPDNTAVYGPTVNTTREVMAAFLFRGYAPSNYKPGAKGKLPFTDISTSHAFYKEIYWMWERGITTGTKQANGTVKFLPAEAVTREATAAFMYRVKSASYTPPAKSPFADVPTTSTFYKHIAWMYAKGVSTGSVTSSGRMYGPKVVTKREETAAFMQRASTF